MSRHPEPLVVKASGLAAGKGAVVCATRREAAATVRAMLGEGGFGDAGRTVVIEAFLEGEEVSVLAITDGSEVELLPVSQDHKRLLEGRRGPNTGGMGAYSPVSVATPTLLERARREVLLPALAEMRRPGDAVPRRALRRPDGGRGGDARGSSSSTAGWAIPRSQVVLPLVSEGLTRVSPARWRRATRRRRSRCAGGASVTTVLASRGYPDAPAKGAPIAIPDRPARGRDGLSRGHRPRRGRRACASRAVGCSTSPRSPPTFAEAQRLSREAAEAIEFEGKVFRRDIGWREAGGAE